MSSKTLRTSIIDALKASSWITTAGIDVFDLDGSSEAAAAFEGDLRESTGAVVCVSQTLKRQRMNDAARSKRILLANTIKVVLRINTGVSSLDLDDGCDAIMSALSGLMSNGAPVQISGDSELVKDSAGILTAHVNVVGNVLL